MPDIYVRNLDIETYNTLIKFKKCWKCRSWVEFVEILIKILDNIDSSKSDVKKKVQ